MVSLIRATYDNGKRKHQVIIQLILYKKYFAEQFGLAEESIDIEYIIAKRKVP